MLAIAIGDIHLNKLSYDQASQKYQFSKSRIQRAVSGKAEHRKGGKQYHQERKRKAEQEASTSAKKSKAMTKTTRRKVLDRFRHAFNNPRNRIPSQTSLNDNDDQFPEVNIDA